MRESLKIIVAILGASIRRPWNRERSVVIKTHVPRVVYLRIAYRRLFLLGREVGNGVSRELKAAGERCGPMSASLSG